MKYVIAGHKGQPEVVKKKVEQDRRRLKSKRDEERWQGEAPISRGIQPRGRVVLKMLPNVKQATIAPLLKASIVPGTLIYTDEYIIYSPLSQWGMTIKVSVTAGRVS